MQIGVPNCGRVGRTVSTLFERPATRFSVEVATRGGAGLIGDTEADPRWVRTIVAVR